MHTLKIVGFTLVATLTGASLATPTFAQEKPAAPKDAKTTATAASSSAQPNEAEMMTQMMALGKPGENHKLLADLAGTWNYKVKFWMAPGMPEHESNGTAVRKSVMDGRYSIMDVAGKMQMPGPDGKMTAMDFKGMAVDAYDNVKKKFVSSWIDSMGTGIVLAEGTYDPATKMLTYHSEMEMMPGMKTKVRETIKMTDKDHHLMEWYETQAGGAEAKTMEISYTRQK